jgi:hypothetical protein
MSHHRAEVDNGHGQDQGEPEPVLEHGGAVPGVLAVGVHGVVVGAVVMLAVRRTRVAVGVGAVDVVGVGAMGGSAVGWVVVAIHADPAGAVVLVGVIPGCAHVRSLPSRRDDGTLGLNGCDGGAGHQPGHTTSLTTP